eukprot:13765930-Alexandrium_andersonii.AAC.1
MSPPCPSSPWHADFPHPVRTTFSVLIVERRARACAQDATIAANTRAPASPGPWGAPGAAHSA